MSVSHENAPGDDGDVFDLTRSNTFQIEYDETAEKIRGLEQRLKNYKYDFKKLNEPLTSKMRRKYENDSGNRKRQRSKIAKKMVNVESKIAELRIGIDMNDNVGDLYKQLTDYKDKLKELITQPPIQKAPQFWEHKMKVEEIENNINTLEKQIERLERIQQIKLNINKSINGGGYHYKTTQRRRRHRKTKRKISCRRRHRKTKRNSVSRRRRKTKRSSF